MTIPAFNIRGMTYDIARAIWRVVLRLEAGPVIFELAPPEVDSGRQSYNEYASVVMAAAVREGWQGPVFLQGDHIAVESMEMLDNIQALLQHLISRNYYQLDIDASHIPTPDNAQLHEFHRPNAAATAKLIEYILENATGIPPITIGAEVGEIGQRNTTPEDIEIFMDLFGEALDSEKVVVDKLSVQTGTKHGGIVLQDGSTGVMPLDLNLASRLSDLVRRKYGIAGLVQHGASTLSLNNLASLPECGVIEVHLATGIQNIVFDHPKFPSDLREMMIERLGLASAQSPEGETQNEPDEELTPAQRFYHGRWEAWGLYKSELWNISKDTKADICVSLEDWIEALFQSLQVAGQREALKIVEGQKIE